jgi:hypothetical protein
VLSTAFCVAVLAATAVAFALTEGAKTELSPIYGTSIPVKVFSPTCNPHICRSESAAIDFRLRKKQHLEVWMDHDGRRVSTIVKGRTYPKGLVQLSFDGLADDGVTILPDGSYQPVIRLTGDHRTIALPNRIEIDTTAPQAVKFPHRVYTHISPDGDKRNDVYRFQYTLNGPGHGVLIVNGHQAAFTRSQKVHGSLTWNGTINHRLQPPGKYTLYFAAQDAAGNRSKPFPMAVVTIRYIELGRTHIDVAPRHRFAIFVLTDATTVHWLFDRGRGASHSHTLRLRAPRKPGTYRLFVSASGHAAQATVVVG